MFHFVPSFSLVLILELMGLRWFLLSTLHLYFNNLHFHFFSNLYPSSEWTSVSHTEFSPRDPPVYDSAAAGAGELPPHAEDAARANHPQTRQLTHIQTTLAIPVQYYRSCTHFFLYYILPHCLSLIFKPGICLAGNTAASQSEAMLENCC